MTDKKHVYLTFGKEWATYLMHTLLKSFGSDYKVLFLHCNHMANETLDALYIYERLTFPDNKCTMLNHILYEFHNTFVPTDTHHDIVIFSVCLHDSCLLHLKSFCSSFTTNLPIYVFAEVCEKLWTLTCLEDIFPREKWRFWTNCIISSYLGSPVKVVTRNISTFDNFYEAVTTSTFSSSFLLSFNLNNKILECLYSEKEKLRNDLIVVTNTDNSSRNACAHYHFDLSCNTISSAEIKRLSLPNICDKPSIEKEALNNKVILSDRVERAGKGHSILAKKVQKTDQTDNLLNEKVEVAVETDSLAISSLFIKYDKVFVFWKYIVPILFENVCKFDNQKEGDDSNSTERFVFVTETHEEAIMVYKNILSVFEQLQFCFDIVLISCLLQSKVNCKSKSLAIVTFKEIFLNIPPFACKHLILHYSVNCYVEWVQLKQKAIEAENISLLSSGNKKLELYEKIDDVLKSKMDMNATKKHLKKSNIESDFEILPEKVLQTKTKSDFEVFNQENLNIDDKQHTYVYSICFSESSTVESASSIGLCVKSPLPFISPIVLFDKYQSVRVQVEYRFEYNIKKSEMGLIEDFMFFMYCDVLKITKVEIGCDYYMCVLLNSENSVIEIDFNKMQQTMEAYQILSELKASILSNRALDKKDGFLNEIENKSLQIKEVYNKFHDTIFVQSHLSLNSLFHLANHTNFKEVVLASDPFPDITKAVTYKEYFFKRYNFLIEENELMIPLNYYKPNFNALKSKNYEKSTKKRTVIYLPLSLLLPVQHISFSLLRCFCLMPSVIYKIKLNVNIFCIQKSINAFSKKQCFSLQLCSTQTEKSIHDGMLNTASNSLNNGILNSNYVSCESHMPDFLTKHKLFLQSIVAANTTLDVNNEVLEFLGDSVIKYIVSVELYLAFPSVKTAVLVHYRNTILSNKYLSELAISRRIDELIIHEIFEPASVFSMKTQRGNKCDLKNVKEKLLADAVEAFIGACFLNVSEDVLYEVFNYFGISITKLPTLQRNGPGIHFSFECELLKSKIQTLRSLELKLGYKFKDPMLYLNACLHHSYPDEFQLYVNKNEFNIDAAISIGSNERLELIGDAILDVLVTREIFRRNGVSNAYKSGNLSLIRSAIVNTYTFSVFATELELHKHMIFNSHVLSRKIVEWLDVYEEKQKDGTVHNEETFNAFVVFHKNRFIEVPKELANIYEAIVGAVYLDNDGNLEEVWRVFFPFMKSVIDFVYNKTPHSVLQFITEAHPGVSFEKLPPHVNDEYTWIMTSNGDKLFVTARSSRIAKAILAEKTFQKLHL